MPYACRYPIEFGFRILNKAAKKRSVLGPIRTAIVGLGRSGWHIHGKTLAGHPKFNLLAASDLRTAHAKEACRELRCEYTLSHKQLLRRADIELVIVAVQPHLHSTIALDALKAGKHVIVERPFAITAKEAKRVLDQASRRGLLAVPFQNRRFDADVLALGSLLASRKLGPLLAAKLCVHEFSRRNDWQTLRANGGGALAQSGSHMVDWALQLFGADLALESAACHRALNPGDAEDSFQLLLKHRNGFNVSIEYLNCSYIQEPKWRLYGRYGTAITDEAGFLVRYCPPSRLRPLRVQRGPARASSFGTNESYDFKEIKIRSDDFRCDTAEAFYNTLAVSLNRRRPFPITREQVLSQMRIIGEARSVPVVNWNSRRR